MSKQQAEENKKFAWCKPTGTVMVTSLPLKTILDRYLPSGTKIDYISIDVEGMEMSVLRSNDWNKYAPDVILVECIDADIEDALESNVHSFLNNVSYNFFAKTGNTLFYKRKGFFEF